MFKPWNNSEIIKSDDMNPKKPRFDIKNTNSLMIQETFFRFLWIQDSKNDKQNPKFSFS